MDKHDQALLYKVFSAVFEGFAFMFVESDPDEEIDPPGPCLQVEIAFGSSEIKGSLEIIAPLDLCNELAENILGTETEELPEGAGENALEEVLNVSCGYLLAEKYGTEEVFDLSIPETVSLPESAWQERIGDDQYAAFAVDESPMLVRIVIDK